MNMRYKLRGGVSAPALKNISLETHVFCTKPKLELNLNTKN
jgi:hypothetical protein